MSTTVKVEKIIGSNFKCQDAVLLRKYIKDNLSDTIILDFEGINHDVPTTFFYTLLSELLYEKDRKYLLAHIKVKNLSNPDDYRRVILGTNTAEKK